MSRFARFLSLTIAAAATVLLARVGQGQVARPPGLLELQPGAERTEPENRFTSTLAGQLELARAADPGDPNVILLRGHEWDVRGGLPQLPAELVGTPTGWRGRYILKFRRPLNLAARRELEERGIVLHEYVPHHAYVATIPTPAAQSFAETRTITQDLELYHPAFKLLPALLEDDLDWATEGGLPVLAVRVFEPEEVAAVAAAVESLGGNVVERSEHASTPGLAVAIPLDRLAAIAQLPEVWIIGPEERAYALNLETVPTNTVGAFTFDRKFRGRGLDGSGQIIAVMDTGLDEGNFLFRDSVDSIGFAGPAHRKIVDDRPWGGGDELACPAEHGTHVAGTALGNGGALGFDPSFDGVAPGARVVFQDIDFNCTSSSVFPPSFLAFPVEDALNLGARIQTNSWGGGSSASYTPTSLDLDRIAWEHKDFTLLFAAGNSGPGGSTLGSQAGAKNVLSVGAHDQDPKQHLIAGFSSRGPVSGSQRIKPELLAAGVDTAGIDDNFADNAGITSANSDGIEGVTNDLVIGGFLGTSMATPAVAGAAALVRQYFEEGFYPQGSFAPSSALVRATLMNATVALDDPNAAERPSAHQGFGRLVLDHTLELCGDDRNLWVADDTVGLATSESVSHTVEVDDPTQPLQVTLLWTDFPGNLLVNDLDLVVEGPGSVTYLGNVFAGDWSTTGGDADATHPFENVFLENPAVGTYTVTVSATNVPMGEDETGKQPFALVVSGGLEAVDSADFPAAAPTPELLAPFDFLRTTDDTPSLMFSATSATGAPLTYEVEWDDDHRFFSPERQTVGPLASGDPATAVPPSLAQGLYWWRVRAAEEGTCFGPWSETSSFTVDDSVSFDEWQQHHRSHFSENTSSELELVPDHAVVWQVAAENDVAPEHDAVTQSSFFTISLCGYDPMNQCLGKYAVDGDPSTQWVSGSSPAPGAEQWVEVQFDESVTARRFVVRSNFVPANRPGDFAIQYWDGADWQTAAAATAVSHPGTFKEFDLDVAVTSERFRLFVSRVESGASMPCVVQTFEIYPNNPADGVTTTPPIAFRDDWDAMVFTSEGDVTLQVERFDGSWSLVPDSDLPGNSSGFVAAASSPVDLSGLDAASYPAVRLRATLPATPGEAPRLFSLGLGAGASAPRIVDESPPDLSTGAPTTTEIQFAIEEVSADVAFVGGVLEDLTVEIAVGEASSVVAYDGSAGGLQSGFMGSVGEDGARFEISLLPDEPFSPGDVVTVDVTVADVSANTRQRSFSFTVDDDASAPVFLDVHVTNVAVDSAEVRFRTNEPVLATMLWDDDSPPENATETGGSFATVHSFPLSELEPDTVYYFTLTGADANGNAGTADNGGGGFWFRTAVVGEVFSDDMESGQQSAWSTEETVGDSTSGNWTLEKVNSNFVWHSANNGEIKDDRLILTVPGSAALANLEFRHAYSFDTFDGVAYDGGVLEVSTDMGGSWNDLGERIVQNGYNSVLIVAPFGNPLQGRSAFGLENPAYPDMEEVLVNLDGFGPGEVRLRWRLGSDYALDYDGWFVDDVTVDFTRPSSTGAVQIGSDVVGCQSSVSITVRDADLDTDPELPNAAIVSVWSTSHGSPMNVVLGESGTDTGTFTGSVQLGTAPAPGVLPVAHGDLVYAWYGDASADPGSVQTQAASALDIAEVDCSVPLVIENVQVRYTDHESAEITWLTNEPATSVVRFGTDPSSLGGVTTDAAPVTEHRVLVTGLDDATRYWFRVESQNAELDTAQSDPPMTFTTLLLVAVHFTDDFDDGDHAGWTESADGKWGIDSGLSHSGDYSIADSPGADYTNNTRDSFLASPTVDAGEPGPSDRLDLRFWHRPRIEPNWDFGLVQVSLDGGTNWGSSLIHVSAVASDFARVHLRLPGGADYSNLAFRFNFFADADTVDDGWYIDDVSVVQLRIDTEPPAVTVDPPGGTLANGLAPFVLQLADEGNVDLAATAATLVLTRDGVPLVPGIDFTTSLGADQITVTPMPGAAGKYVLSLQPKDTAGNQGAASFEFFDDRTPPVLVGAVPADGGAVASLASWVLSFDDDFGFAEAATAGTIALTRNGNPLTLGDDYTIDASLPDLVAVTFAIDDPGKFELLVTPTDDAGNTAATETVDVRVCAESVSLSAMTITADETFAACRRLSAGDGFSVEAPSVVRFVSGKRIVLRSGFAVQSGATFRAGIDPVLDP